MTIASLHGARPWRRAFVAPMVLIALLAAGAILLGMARTAAARKAAFELSAGRCQAAILAESGLERAATRLRADPAYTGETWRLPAVPGDGFRGAAVTIEVQPIADRPNVRRVHVAADCPDDLLYRMRSEKQTLIVVKSREAKE